MTENNFKNFTASFQRACAVKQLHFSNSVRWKNNKLYGYAQGGLKEETIWERKFVIYHEDDGDTKWFFLRLQILIFTFEVTFSRNLIFFLKIICCPIWWR